jgi:LysE type translocator
VVLVLVAGPNFCCSNQEHFGRLRGWSSAVGVTCSNAVQGVAAATGLGAVVGVGPLFEAIKWAGIAYLAFLAMEALRSAAAGRYVPFDHEKLVHQLGRGWRQGFVSNITHRKITGKHAGKPRCVTAEEKFSVPAVATNCVSVVDARPHGYIRGDSHKRGGRDGPPCPLVSRWDVATCLCRASVSAQ